MPRRNGAKKGSHNTEMEGTLVVAWRKQQLIHWLVTIQLYFWCWLLPVFARYCF